MKKIKKPEEEWKKNLTPEQYHILREKGTERAFSGSYNSHKGKGMYVCTGCGSKLFSSNTKFDSGTGWPSFHSPVSKESVETKTDFKMVLPRTEVLCSKCGGHLGHVFNDGPEPTGKRYCINSLSLCFNDEKELKRRTNKKL